MLEQEFQIAQLISNYWNGTITSDELVLLKKWINESDQHRCLFEQSLNKEAIDGGVRDLDLDKEENELNFYRLVKVIEVRKKAEKRMNRRMVFLKYAAVVLLPVFVLVALFRLHSAHQAILPERRQVVMEGAIVLKHGSVSDYIVGGMMDDSLSALKNELSISSKGIVYEHETDTVETHTLIIPRGKRFKVQLTDGTVICLNSESKLIYPSKFEGKERRVVLEGEGYFDVKKDKEHPFVVETNDLSVRVLGTSFGIRAYSDEENMRTTLVEGSVQVEGENICTALKPGHMLEYNRVSRHIENKEVDVNEYVGWKDGILCYNNVALEEILSQLERMYSCKIVCAGSAVGKIPFTIKLPIYSDIDSVLNMIALTNKVVFNHKEETITVNILIK